MNRTHRTHRTRIGEKGLTLVELMISMVIMSIAVGAALSLGLSTTNSYRVHREMDKTARAARVSLEIMADAVRNASAGVPDGNITDVVGCSASGAIKVTNSTTGPDELEVTYASGGVLTTLAASYTALSTELVVRDGTQFQPGDYVIITDLERGHIVPVTAVTPVGPNYELTTPDTPNALCGTGFAVYPPGATFVIRAQISRFFIDSAFTGGNVPTLMMDPDSAGPIPPQPLAEGVEDLQIAIGVDEDDDDIVNEDGTNTDEWFYNAVGDSAPPGLPRALRINLVARSVLETSDTAQSSRPAMEDHAAGATPDEFRRRVLSTTIEVRNLEGSP